MPDDLGAKAKHLTAEVVGVTGTFYRHISLKFDRLKGSSRGGRWSPPSSYSVLYLGRPVESVVAEAYRHLVDPVEEMTGELVAPRLMVACTIKVERVLDLRDLKTLKATGLSQSDLSGSHSLCQPIGMQAYVDGLHGIIAPAATGLGETLALFEDRLSSKETPTIIDEQLWLELPEDPR